MNDPTIRGDGPHRSGVGDATQGRRRAGRLVIALTASLLLVGPWPVDDPASEWAGPLGRTLGRLDASTGSAPPAPIRVGTAEVDLSPDSPRPLAGFVGQVRTTYRGVDGPCMARALTVEAPSGRVTILTADLLLINRKLAEAVVRKAGLRPEEVYFTASHTHSGPGGWGDHPLEMLVAGSYDPAFFEQLATRLAEVVRRSRASTEPSEFALVRVEAKARQTNRIEPGSTTHDALSALVFRPARGSEATPPLAILAVFGAHATVAHEIPPRLGGDYPSALASELKRRTGARTVLFAAGAVGDASPVRPKAPSTSQSAEALGKALAGDLMAALPSARFEKDVSIGNLRLAVEMPSVRLPFSSARLRFSPLLTWWIADRSTHLHALRIGPAVLVGFPGDYAGDLADRLEAPGRAGRPTAVATSFDGDYRGYLVSGAVFRRRGCYETRWMNFYGSGGGDRLTDLAVAMIDRLSSDSAGPPPLRVSTIADDDLARIALALLALAVAVAIRSDRSSAVGLARRAGLVAVGLAVAALVAFEVAPGWSSWMKFGVPKPFRLAALPIGLAAVIGARRLGAGRSALIVAAASGLVAANWVVVLMSLRGWARASLVDRLPRPVGRESSAWTVPKSDSKSAQKS